MTVSQLLVNLKTKVRCDKKTHRSVRFFWYKFVVVCIFWVVYTNVCDNLWSIGISSD
jgi:hypothetical protein